jgi:hypothetical protein
LGVKNVQVEIIEEDDPTPNLDYPPPPPRQGLRLEVVNGWYSKINQGKASEGELKWWKSRAGSRATIKKTTFVRGGVHEPAVAVYLDGGQFGWIARAHISAVKREMHGYLASGGLYTLDFICD